VLKAWIARLLEGRSLAAEEAEEAMRAVVSGEASPVQVGAYLIALRLKGETAAEILGSARVVRESLTPVVTSRTGLLDTCGTGGDGSRSFNVSTAAALVCAGAGLAVAKHGNRSVSSRCGSADLLEACGVRLDLTAEEVARVLEETGIGFLFAPALNGAMAAVAPVRRELGQRTIFNLLGPLANPAGATRQLLGVYDAKWVEPLAEVLRGLGSERALVVHGLDGPAGPGGLDEISISGPTRAALLERGLVALRTLTPESFGVQPHPPGSIAGGDPGENRERLASVLAGRPCPLRDAVVANAGAALWVGEAAREPFEGARLAEKAIDSGAAAAALDRLVEASARVAAARGAP